MLFIWITECRTGASRQWTKGGIFETRLNAVNYSVPPYSEAYPLLAHYWEDDPAFPRNNVIEGNVFYRVNSFFKGDLSYAEWNNNYMAQKNPGFKDEEEMRKIQFAHNSPSYCISM